MGIFVSVLLSVIVVLPIKAHLLLTGRILYTILHPRNEYTIHHHLLLGYYLHDSD